MSRTRKVATIAVLSVLGLFLVIQLVPYGRDHANPPVVAEPSWDDPSTRALAVRACFDCHSNETHWRWYANVAPTSWLAQWHVDEGRRVLNFSEWHRSYEEAPESAETITTGEMPPPSYLLLHPEARLSDQEKRALASGLTATIGGEPGGHAASAANQDED
jgi:hypothetical protein